MNQEERAEEALTLHRALSDFFKQEHEDVYHTLIHLHPNCDTHELQAVKHRADALMKLEENLKSYIQDHELSVLKGNRR